MGSPNGSLPDLDGTGFRPSTVEEKINEMFIQIAKLPLLMQSISRFEKCVQTLSQTVATYSAKIKDIEQIVCSLAARVTILERMQRPPPVVPARQALGTCLDIVMAPQSLGLSGPMGQGHLTITETQDVDFILSQVPKTNMREVPFYHSFRANNTTLKFPCESIASGTSPTYQPTTNPSGFIENRWPIRQTRLRDES